MRQIVLDTETTGLEVSQGHRVIEIGAVEMVNRKVTEKHFHHFVNPQREIDAAATEVHGITAKKLANKPFFDAIAVKLLDYLAGAELIIHNAPFDMGFLHNEFKLCGYGDRAVADKCCNVLDSLVMARGKHPGQKNSLDALCERYGVDHSQRAKHGALLDARLLAEVYLRMTRGQTTLLGSVEKAMQSGQQEVRKISATQQLALKIVIANEREVAGHEKWLELLRERATTEVVWDKLV